jgi:CMP/dCMP kinase
MIITVSGTAGSGKSTIAKIIAKKLKAKRIYVGGMRRELARSKGMSLEELNEYAKTHAETDVEVDKEAARLARSLERGGNIVVVEGRTQFYFLSKSIKIFVKVAAKVGAKRIWKDLQDIKKRDARNEGNIKSLSEMEKEVITRDRADAKRYKKYYGFDHRDESNYDLVIDSTKLSVDEVVKQVMHLIDNF